jgi:hypothetical protein
MAAGVEEVAELIVASIEPVGGSWALEPTHRPIPTFDATVILLQPIVEIAAGSVLHSLAQRRPNALHLSRAFVAGPIPGRSHLNRASGAGPDRTRMKPCTNLTNSRYPQRWRSRVLG